MSGSVCVCVYFMLFLVRVYSLSSKQQQGSCYHTKESSWGNPSKAASDIIIARRWHGSSLCVRGEMEIKNLRVGQDGNHQKKQRQKQWGKEGNRWRADKRVVWELVSVLCYVRQGCARLCVVQHWLLSPNGHSYDTSDAGQPLLFISLWCRHTEQRDNEVQSSSGKEGQL